MATTTLTPELHPVFNELDKIGLLLGLPRLEAERNAEYRMRLFDVLVNRAGASYRGLINGVTRELGLKLFDAFILKPTNTGTNPAVVFKDTKCYVYEDYSLLDDGLDTTIDRFESDGDGFTIDELMESIEATGLFTCDLVSGTNPKLRAMTIFNQSTVITVPTEEIDVGGARIKLQNANLVPNTVTVRSANMTERVTSTTLLRKPGQYYVDLVPGIIYSTVAPAVGSAIRYQYRDDNFTVAASPVIIHNLQSSDFRSKMFEQETLNGETTDGAVTPYGLDLINELLSVYPLGWGF